MAEVELVSMKYLQAAAVKEKSKARWARDVKALHDFATFVFGLAAMFFGTYAVQEHERWMPAVVALLGM